MVSPVDLTQYTIPAQRVMALAEEEALASGNEGVGTGHILLSLLRERGCVAAEALESVGVSFEMVSHELGDMVHSQEFGLMPHGISRRIPFTMATERVLQRARIETLTTGHAEQERTAEGRPVICTGEILLGLLHVPTDAPASGVAAGVLFRLGIDITAPYERVYEQIAEFVRQYPANENRSPEQSFRADQSG